MTVVPPPSSTESCFALQRFSPPTSLHDRPLMITIEYLSADVSISVFPTMRKPTSVYVRIELSCCWIFTVPVAQAGVVVATAKATMLIQYRIPMRALAPRPLDCPSILLGRSGEVADHGFHALLFSKENRI